MHGIKPVFYADFDQNYRPINDNYPAKTPGQYTVAGGETLADVARSVWGDASLWYLLAEANGLSGGEALKTGLVLNIPNQVTNIHNNADTFRPYDAGRAIGDVSPTLPDAPIAKVVPEGDSCGAAQIIMIIVAIVVTIFTFGAALGAMGFVATAGMTAVQAAMAVGWAGVAALAAAGAVGAAAGNMASQLVGMAMGVQDSFSWSDVGKSALSGGLTAGVTFGLGQFATAGSTFGNIMGNAYGAAAVNNIANQGVNMLLGEQKRFDWRSVAASVAGQAAIQGVGAAIKGDTSLLSGQDGGYQFAGNDTTTNSTISNLSSSVIREGLSNVIYGTRFNYAGVAQSTFQGVMQDSYNRPPASKGQVTDGTEEAKKQKEATNGNAQAKQGTREIAKTDTLKRFEQEEVQVYAIEDYSTESPVKEIAPYNNLEGFMTDAQPGIAAAFGQGSADPSWLDELGSAALRFGYNMVSGMSSDAYASDLTPAQKAEQEMLGYMAQEDAEQEMSWYIAQDNAERGPAQPALSSDEEIDALLSKTHYGMKGNEDVKRLQTLLNMPEDMRTGNYRDKTQGYVESWQKSRDPFAMIGYEDVELPVEGYWGESRAASARSSAIVGGDVALVNKLKAYLQDPHTKAWLDTIQWAEGGQFDEAYGNVKVTDFSKHPGKVNGEHSPFGAYQIIEETYNGWGKQLGVIDISPESQQIIAARLLMYELHSDGGMKNLTEGKFDVVLKNASRTWAALPMGSGTNDINRPTLNGDPQPYKKYNEVKSFYEASLNRYKQ